MQSYLTIHQWLYLIAIGFLFILDLLLKFVYQHFQTLPFTLNRAAAFSLPLPNSFLIVVTLFIIVLFLHTAYVKGKQLKIKELFLYTLIILGALSNVIDRIFYGGVVDYIILTSYVPAFNGADIFIVGGIAGILYTTVKRRFHAQ